MSKEATARSAMKLALEALAVKFSEGRHEGIKIDASDIMLLNDAAQALASEAKEQPAPVAKPHEQEPVAWRTYTGRGYYIIDATLKEAQRNWPDKQHQPLYTSPPAQRQARSADTWVDLTKDEVFAVSNTMPYGDRFDFAEAIEAKLKEKNNG